MSFDLKKSLRRFKPERRTARLMRRLDAYLPFVFETVAGGSELLLDTFLRDCAPEAVNNLLMTRVSNHSGVALAELTHLFGRLNPRDVRTAGVRAEISGVIVDIPRHRVTAPSLNVLGEAGILSGLAARMASIEAGREQALLNDSTLYLEQGLTVLTRNVREFDWFEQLLASNRVLFYRQI